jgi:hypothetical protein
MTTQTIDRAALDAEVAAIVETAPPLTIQPGVDVPAANDAEVSGDIEISWCALTPPIFQIVDTLVLPQWELKAAEKKELSEATGQILDQLFPGGIGNEKWAPYVRLFAAVSAIALSRVDPETKRLPPIGFPKPAPKTEQSGES